MKSIIIHCKYHFQSKAMRVMQTQLLDLCAIMECHFQRSINQAMHMAVTVQIHFNSGESDYQLTCAYYYLFLFSGWWFNRCTFVALNGKYNPLSRNYGFLWYSRNTGFVLPNRSEMKIRRQ